MSDTIRIIKKYPNRRLYDTEESRYIALSDILDFIHKQIPFKVVDTQSAEDITRTVLVQIILDQENGENYLFTKDMLENFIRHYDDSTRLIFSEFLDKNFQLFEEQHRIVKDQMNKLIGKEATHNLSDIAQSNLDFWQDMQNNFLKSAGLYPIDKTDKNPNKHKNKK